MHWANWIKPADGFCVCVCVARLWQKGASLGAVGGAVVPGTLEGPLASCAEHQVFAPGVLVPNSQPRESKGHVPPTCLLAGEVVRSAEAGGSQMRRRGLESGGRGSGGTAG